LITVFLERLAERYVAEARIEDLRMARDEHAQLTGWFEDGEPWYEERVNHFHDWYLLDRVGEDRLTPAERYLSTEWNRLNEPERGYFEGLACSQRSVFRMVAWRQGAIGMEDLIGGAFFEVSQTIPMTGFLPGDMVDARLIPAEGEIYLGRSIIAHPREAHEAIAEILELCRSRGELDWSIADKLLKMRLKFDRYPNMRLKHVYRDPRMPIL